MYTLIAVTMGEAAEAVLSSCEEVVMVTKKFSVWVAPEKRDEIGIKDDKFWVVNKESSSYATEEHRGIWNTREEAQDAVVEDWEEVIEMPTQTSMEALK